MPIPRYKLVNIETGEVLGYSDEKIRCGGSYGPLQDKGKAEWQESMDLTTAKENQIAKLVSAAAVAYVAGFESSASGAPLWYDSDDQSQRVIDSRGLLAISAPAVFDVTVFMSGVPVGKIPITARPTATDPDSAKTAQFLDSAQMVQLAGDLATAWASVKSKLWEKKSAVYTARTMDEVFSINW